MIGYFTSPYLPQAYSKIDQFYHNSPYIYLYTPIVAKEYKLLWEMDSGDEMCAQITELFFYYFVEGLPKFRSPSSK